MIEVIYKDKIIFENINEYYKWLMEHKNNIDEIKINGNSNSTDLYNFIKYYMNVLQKFKIEIDKYNSEFKNTKDNSLVTDALNELIRMNSDGKFVRATLIALGFDSLNKEKLSEKYMPLAIAYETFQTSILIHDDIIDNAKLRRGKITIPKSYENVFDKYEKKDEEFEKRKNHIANSLGICIGDLGFYLASKIVINNYKNDKNFDNILDLYNKIVINTIKGEIIDVVLPFNEEYKNNLTTEDDVMEIYKLKTAWYSIIGPFCLGMGLSDASKEEMSKMEDMLLNLGIAFQIKDDILGIYGDEDEIGKSASSDISEFKQTILYTYLSNNKDYLLELNKYYGKSNNSAEDIKKVKELFEKSGAKDYAIKKMENMFRISKEKLKEISFISENYKSILRGFITYLDLRTK